MTPEHGRPPGPADVAAGPSTARARFDVTMRPSGPQLRISGALDLASAPRLTSLLDVLLRYPAVVTVDTADVEFADCAGVTPLVEASRPDDGVRRVVLARTGPAFRRVFVVLGVDCEPHIDVDAWDAAGG